jgi:hypothetical protein
MGFIPTVTCKKCGRQYSGLKNHCPYCGAKHVKATTRTPATTAAARPGTAAASRASANTRWQAIFGIILLVAVITAVIVLITVSLGDAEPVATTPAVTTPAVTTAPPVTPTPTPEPTPTVTSITISYFTDPKTEFSMSVGGQIPLTATVYPLDVEATATWRSTDESICTVDENGVVTGVSAGWGSVIAECGGVAAECKVLVQ